MFMQSILFMASKTSVLLPGKSHGQRSLVGCGPWGRKESDTTKRLHFHFSLHALEKEMATHSSVLAWRIPETAEPGGLLSLGSRRVGHDWSNLATAAAAAARGMLWNTLLLRILRRVKAQGGVKDRNYKGHMEALGSDEHVNHLDGYNGFTKLEICQNLSNCTL